MFNEQPKGEVRRQGIKMKTILSIFFIGILAFVLSLPQGCNKRKQATTDYRVVCENCEKVIEDKKGSRSFPTSSSSAGDTSSNSNSSASNSTRASSNAEQKMNEYYSAMASLADEFESYIDNRDPFSETPLSLWDELFNLNSSILDFAEDNPGVSGGDDTLYLMGSTNYLLYDFYDIGGYEAAMAYYLLVINYPNSFYRSDAIQALSELEYGFWSFIYRLCFC